MIMPTDVQVAFEHPEMYDWSGNEVVYTIDEYRAIYKLGEHIRDKAYALFQEYNRVTKIEMELAVLANLLMGIGAGLE